MGLLRRAATLDMQVIRWIALFAVCGLVPLSSFSAQDAAEEEDAPPQPASLTFIFSNFGEARAPRPVMCRNSIGGYLAGFQRFEGVAKRVIAH